MTHDDSRKYDTISNLNKEYIKVGQRTYRPKRCGNINKDEDNSPKTLNDKNHQASSQKFRQPYGWGSWKLDLFQDPLTIPSTLPSAMTAKKIVPGNKGFCIWITWIAYYFYDFNIQDDTMILHSTGCNSVLMLNWIVWNRTDYLYKNGIGIK